MTVKHNRSFPALPSHAPGRLVGSALALGLLFLAAPASAQDMDRAVGAFSDGDYETAAAMFYAVTQFDDDKGTVAEAQYGLAQSFAKLGLHLAALKYFEDVIKEGSDHPYFTNAIEGLIDVGEAIQDDLKVPAVIDAMYTDENLSAIEKMNPELRQRVHYVIGRLSFTRENIQDARDFLGTVKRGNVSYADAQYLLALIRLGVGRRDNPKPKYDKALAHFRNVREAIPLDDPDEGRRKLRDLATLGIARVKYERAYLLEDGDPKRSKMLRSAIRLYRTMPRFSHAWPDALFERAWAHTVNNEYGKALGALHSLYTPYFDEYFYPEKDTLRAIIYYYNCQWDRVNAVVEETRAKNRPMIDQMQRLLDSDLAYEDWYALLGKSLAAGKNHGKDDLMPWTVAKAIARDAKFAKMELFLKELEREGEIFQTSDTFGRSDMGREMTDFALETRDAYLAVIGKYVKVLFQGNTTELADVTTRLSFVSLETKSAEAEWLEQGRSIGGKPRGVLPRPFVPDDTFEFWHFRGEYWIDELGYYEYSIKTECYE